MYRQKRATIPARADAEMKAKHPSVGDVRSIGLFGVLELVRNRATKEPMAPFNGISPEMLQLGAYLREQGMYAFINWNNLFTNRRCASPRRGFASRSKSSIGRWRLPTLR